MLPVLVVKGEHETAQIQEGQLALKIAIPHDLQDEGQSRHSYCLPRAHPQTILLRQKDLGHLHNRN